MVWPNEVRDRWGGIVRVPLLTTVRLAWLLCDFSKFACFLLTGHARRRYVPSARGVIAILDVFPDETLRARL